MAKSRINKKKYKQEQEYYNLKVDAVNSLSDALKEDPYSDPKEKVELNGNDPYKVDKLSKVPAIIKVIFLKYWFSGLTCYLIMIGLGLYITNDFDMFVAMGIATGLVNDIFVNSILLYYETDKKEFHKYIMLPVPCKKVWTLLINIPLGFVEVLGVYYIYVFLNSFIFNGGLGVEPLLYGLFFLAVDGILIGIKDLIVYLIRKNKKTMTD